MMSDLSEHRERVAEALRRHQLHASMNICTGCDWRATQGADSLVDQHEAHQADTLLAPGGVVAGIVAEAVDTALAGHADAHPADLPLTLPIDPGAAHEAQAVYDAEHDAADHHCLTEPCRWHPAEARIRPQPVHPAALHVKTEQEATPKERRSIAAIYGYEAGYSDGAAEVRARVEAVLAPVPYGVIPPRMLRDIRAAMTTTEEQR